MSKPIFISHAAANKNLAERLVVLMETGIGISADSDIFCSSLQGTGIPSGTNFSAFIREQISKPRAVVLLLTADYFRSEFCLCELGASWVLAHRIIPLLVPPLERKDVKVVLAGVQLLDISRSDDLTQMREDLIGALSIAQPKSVARWEASRSLFLADTKVMLGAVAAADTIISREKYDDLKTRYEVAVSDISALQAESDTKSGLITELKALKNAEDVRRVVESRLPDKEKFETLVHQAKAAMRPLPHIVEQALYYHLRDEWLPQPHPLDESARQDVQDAIEADYLCAGDDGLELVEDDPRVSDALDALSQLKDFVECVGEEFNSYYVSTYDHRLNFSSKRFWGTHLW
jgi:hypothetical protein